MSEQNTEQTLVRKLQITENVDDIDITDYDRLSVYIKEKLITVDSSTAMQNILSNANKDLEGNIYYYSGESENGYINGSYYILLKKKE